MEVWTKRAVERAVAQIHSDAGSWGAMSGAAHQARGGGLFHRRLALVAAAVLVLDHHVDDIDDDQVVGCREVRHRRYDQVAR